METFLDVEGEAMRSFAMAYNPRNPKHLAALKALDATFTIHWSIRDVRRPLNGYLLRVEAPFSHFVSFTDTFIVGWLPPHCHEVIDGAETFRMFFDIEHEICAEEMARFKSFAEARRLPNRQVLDGIARDFAAELASFLRRTAKEKRAGQKIKGDVDVFVGKSPKLTSIFRKTVAPTDIHEPIVLTSHRDAPTAEQLIKFSAHIIMPNFYVSNHEAAAELARRFREHMLIVRSSRANWIDMGVYKSRMMLRMHSMSKLGEDRPIVLLGEGRTDFASHTVAQQEFGSSTWPAMPITYKPRPKYVGEMPPDDFIQRVFAENACLAGYSFNGRIDGGKYCLDFDPATPCLVCKKRHSDGSRRQFITYVYGRARFCCGISDHERHERSVPLNYGIDECQVVKEAGDAYLRAIGIGSSKVPTQTICDQFIGKAMAAAFASHHHILITSAMGTGKTSAVADILREFGTEDVVMISFRKSFSKEKSQQLGLASYLDMSKDKGSLGKEGLPRGLIIQVEALGRICPLFKPRLIILDEIESIVAQVAGYDDRNSNFYGTNNSDPIAAMLHKLIASAGRLIAMDANTTGESLRYLQRATSGHHSTLHIHNTYKPAVAIKGAAYIYRSAGEVIYNMLEALKAGQRIAFVSPSKSEVDAATEAAAAVIGATQCYKATGEGREEREAAIDEAGGASALLEAYQFVAYNSVFLAGIDIQNRDRQAVYACFGTTFITPPMALQLMGRVRNIAEVHFWACDSGSQRAYDIADEFGIYFDDKGARDAAKGRADIFTKLIHKHKMHAEAGKAERRLSILALLARHGFSIMNLRAAGRIDTSAQKKEAVAEDSRKILGEVLAIRGAYAANNEADNEEARRACAVRDAEAAGEPEPTFDEPVAKVAIPKMDENRSNIVYSIKDAYGLTDADIARLSADEITELRSHAALSRARNLDEVKNWSDCLSPYNYDNEDSGTIAVDYSAKKARVVGHLKMQRALRALFGDFDAHIYGGDPLSAQTFKERFAEAASIYGLGGDMAKALKAFNAEARHYGFSVASTATCREEGKKIKTGYVMKPASDYIAIGRRLYHKIAQKAIETRPIPADH